MCSKQGLTLRELCLRFRLRTFRYFNQYLSRGIQFSRASLNAAPETVDRSRDLFLWKRWMWQNNVYEINHKSCMRTVPGSEIVVSAELRRREHKKNKQTNKTKQKKERKKEVKIGRKLGRGRAAVPVISANFSHALHFRVSFPPLSLSPEQAT